MSDIKYLPVDVEPLLKPGTPRKRRSWIQRLLRKQPGQELENESLDFDPVQNRVSQGQRQQRTERRHFYGYTGHTLAKFAITASAGICTGLIAAGLATTTEYLILARKAMLVAVINAGTANEWFAPAGLLRAYGFHMGFSIALVLLAGCLVQFWAPAAAGGGVAQVMAYLNGSDVPDLLRARTLVAKLLGTVCGVVSNMAVGPEAPMVHVGAGLASVISFFEGGALLRWCCWIKARRRPTNGIALAETQGRLHSDADHREFISAGAAAGLAAAFGAPIGGVLFSMEEACSYWSARVLWRCLLAAAFATFTLAQLHPRSQAGLLSFDGRRDTMANIDWLWQGPFFVLVSVAAGLLGALFNLLRKWLWRIRASRKVHFLRLLEVVGLAVFTITVIFALSWRLGRCIQVPDEWADVKYGFQFNCPEGQYNDLATQFMSIPAETIRRIFAMNVDPPQNPVLGETIPWNSHCGPTQPCRFTLRSLGITSISYVVLMAAASGLAVPGGLFMPSIMVGSSFGAMCGLLLLRLLPPGWNIQPGVYAVVAATATLAGVFRSSISLVVVVVEGTRGIDFTFGVIIAVVCANWVAHHIHRDGVYESELERDGTVFFLRHEPPHALRHTTAARIMAPNVVTLNEVESLAHVVDVLRCYGHNGFPVYALDRDAPDRPAQLAGLILRSQLLVLLENGVFYDAHGRLVGRGPDSGEKLQAQLDAQMRGFYRRHHMHRRSRASQPDMVDRLVATQLRRLQLASADGLISNGNGAGDAGAVAGLVADMHQLYLDLRPFMHLAPMTIRPDCAGPRLHEIFYQLGLRHLLVVDATNRVVGMITRKDLDRAAGHGWWRMNSLPANPAERSVHQPRSGMSGLLQQLVTSPAAFARSLSHGRFPSNASSPRHRIGDALQSPLLSSVAESRPSDNAGCPEHTVSVHVDVDPPDLSSDPAAVAHTWQGSSVRSGSGSRSQHGQHEAPAQHAQQPAGQPQRAHPSAGMPQDAQQAQRAQRATQEAGVPPGGGPEAEVAAGRGTGTGWLQQLPTPFRSAVRRSFAFD